MGRRSDPHWRDRAASELAASLLDRLPVEGPVLVVDDPEPAAAEGLRSRGVEVTIWSRTDRPGGDPGAPWPPAGPFAHALIRLPQSRATLEFALHGVASVLDPGGRVWVYGAKDEGIASTGRQMEPLLHDVRTLDTRRRCRVLEGRWSGREARGPGFALPDWRSVTAVDIGGASEEWVGYPGTFARGGVDAGTRLLLEHLPALSPKARVLDFAAGTGVLAAALRRSEPSLRLVLVEPDALARLAARENVPGAGFAPTDRWWNEGPFDAVVSNPPYHRGKVESLDVVESLVARAPAALVPGGELRMVVQRRFPVEPLLERGLTGVEVVADEGPYRVWRAERG